MKKPVIVGLGEVLWDVFPEYKRAGGAPANVAYHARQLGNEGITASRVGVDDDGRELLDVLISNGLDTAYIQKDEVAPTGTVEVTMTDGEASYSIPLDSAWDRLAMTSQWLDLARSADAVCFGTLAQRDEISRRTIREFLAQTPAACTKIADINLRPPHYTKEVIEASLDLADVVKLNQQEWKDIQRMFGVDDLNRWLFTEKKVRIICLTKGGDGAELITPDQHLIEPVHPIEDSNGDSVGVGDAFTAGLTHHLLRNSPLDVAISAANRYAAQVFARKGATPKLPDAVIDGLR
ncbi:MAG: carbohydrate kinase [Balneolaceae bacterium]|nr:MAG: carbohydrate kinase [Balneolaceae bacterium]